MGHYRIMKRDKDQLIEGAHHLVEIGFLAPVAGSEKEETITSKIKFQTPVAVGPGQDLLEALSLRIQNLEETLAKAREELLG